MRNKSLNTSFQCKPRTVVKHEKRTNVLKTYCALMSAPV